MPHSSGNDRREGLDSHAEGLPAAKVAGAAAPGSTSGAVASGFDMDKALSWAPGYPAQPRSGSQGWLLDDPGLVWGVVSGYVDVFAVRIQEADAESGSASISKPCGARHFVARVGPDSALAGCSPHNLPSAASAGSANPPDGQSADTVPRDGRDAGFCLYAVPAGLASVVRIERTAFWEQLDDPADRMLYALAVAEWAETILAVFPEAMAPDPCQPARPGTGQSLASGNSLVPSGAALCVRLLAGSVTLVSDPALTIGPADGWIPLTRETWLEAEEDAVFDAVHLVQGMASDATLRPLDTLLGLLLRSLAQRIRRDDEFEAQRLEKRSAASAKLFRRAMAAQASVFASDREHESESGHDPLFAACRSLGPTLGIAFKAPMQIRSGTNPVAAIARASGLRFREVSLEGRWWRQDNGPLLGFLAGSGNAASAAGPAQDAPDIAPSGTAPSEGSPVALVPRIVGGYRAIPGDGSPGFLIRRDEAPKLLSRGFMFYRCLPDRPVGAGQLLGFALQGSYPELAGMAILSLLAALIGLAVPLFTRMVFKDIIPSGNGSSLLGIAALLGTVALVLATLAFSQGMFSLRLIGRIDLRLQAGLWDRLLKLPAGFFRRYAAGDIASRVLNFDQLTGSVASRLLPAILGAVFSLVNIALILTYSPRLATLALVLTLVSFVASALVAFAQRRPRQALFDLRGKLSGDVLQLLSAIAKLRDSGSEERAFARWSDSFSSMMRHSIQAQRISSSGRVFELAFPMAASALTTLVFFQLEPSLFQTGQFMAFGASFGQLVAGSAILSGSLAELAGLLPLYRRVLPIFEAVPEVDESKLDPGRLRGHIAMTAVNFGYEAGSPRILSGVNLEVRPGQFVAIVGPSGAGKSTIFRLLLGFERVDSGEIRYDGQDLRSLDPAALRRQVSTVLQNGKVFSGSIYENICGAAHLTQDEAWEMARAAGLAADIEAMPMGMFTFVTEGGVTLSGGQRQRLLIARALAMKPAVLLFDEATSALDNRTQAVVMENLAAMRISRLVIAQRLSTVKAADRIYVLEKGSVVQSGSFEELMARPGLFRQLAERQLV